MKHTIVVLIMILILGSGSVVLAGEPSARKLVAQLTDGNEHRIANNLVVEQLVAKGEKSLVPLRQAILDEDFEGRGYAAWAMGSVLRAMGKRPLEMTAALHAAAGSSDDYVKTLARSALSILGNPPTSTAAARKPEPNPYIVAALRDAPKAGTSPEELVAALPKRKGHWRDIIVDRLVMVGKKSIPAVKRAALDESFGAPKEAKWALSRLTAVCAAKPATPEMIIAAFQNDPNAYRANNAQIDRLLLHGSAAIPDLVAEMKKPRNARKSYASYALVKLLRATGERPKEAMEILTTKFKPGVSPLSILGM